MNENLREILPYLRPRSAELTPFTITVLVLLCLGMAGLVLLYYMRHRRHLQEQRERFEELGLEKQLSQSQIQTLFQIGRQRRMSNLPQLLNSVHVFDRQVGAVTQDLLRQPDHHLFTEIANIRSRLQFDHLPVDQALRTTRQVPTGLTIIVWTHVDEEAGGVPWLVTARDERGIETGPLLKEDHSLDGLQVGGEVTVRFWREGDTEYHFTSEILELDTDSRMAILRHASRMERLQLRDFFRLEIAFDITLQPRPGAPVPLEPEADAVGDDEEVGSSDALSAELEPADVETEEASFEEYATPPVEPDTEETEEPLSVDAEGEMVSTEPVNGEVLDISAGGMRVLLHEEDPRAFLMQVPPGFTGPFPLAGITCMVTGRNNEPGGVELQLKFLDLPPQLEREMVRKIYQNQVLLNGPDGPTAPTQPSQTEDLRDDGVS